VNLQQLVPTGFPGARDEAWKYTRPAAFLQPQWTVAADVPPVREPGADLVLVDGTATDERDGSVLDAGEGDAEAAGFDALNRKLARHGLRLHVPAGASVEREVLHVATGRGHLGATRHVVELGAGSRLQLVERFVGSGPSFTSAALDVVLGEGAELIHVRLVEEANTVLHHGRIGAQLGASARYTLVSLVLGGSTVRIEPTVRLIGHGASADLHGLVALRGEQHADHHVTVDHVGPGCTSRQAFRSLLDGRSRGVYTGAVRVRPGADGTDSGQVHRALLLSDDAVANARPQLEIEADDVKCAHGAAIGALDEEMLFYLQQRGLDRLQARALLTSGFVNETLSAVPEGALRERVERAFVGWVTT
jgi:Fe-S cluster assembly protein SufD